MILTSLVFQTDQRSGPRSVRRPPFTPLTPFTVPFPRPAPRPARPAESLGVASVSGRWQWADPTSATTRVVPLPAPAAAAASTPDTSKMAAVRVPPLLLQEMRAAAAAQGRSLGDIWAEAAREWLRRHTHEDEPQPPTPAAAALAVPMPTRSWAAIDSVLAALRRSPDSAA